MRTRTYRWASGALTAALLVAASGCDIDAILDVEDPDIVVPEQVTGEEGAATLRAGALGDFQLAYAGDAGTIEGQILVSGMFTDEYVHSGTFPTRREYDRRDVDPDNGTATNVFQNLSRARQALETAATTFLDVLEDPSADPRVGEMWGLAGFTYVLFGENYCSGIPYSQIVEGEIVHGDPTTTQETFEIAVERFQEAIASAAGDSDVENAARIGLGRALVNLGRWDEAAQAVEDVPSDFVLLANYSTNTGNQENGVYNFNVVFERWSLADAEADEGLAFRSADDPRVPWTRVSNDVGFDGETPQFDMLKYPGRAEPIPIATGDEARLIEAEAALQAGNGGLMASKINEVRARHGLGQVSDPGGEAARVDLLFSERAFTLFATSHRLGDMRRLVRQYGRDASDVFPSGEYFKGGEYGGDLNLPVPFQEENNPAFQGCFDRGA